MGKSKEYVEININQHVYLMMDDRDFEVWMNYDNRLCDTIPAIKRSTIQDMKDRADKETGLVKMQIHEYISIFGAKIKGFGRLPCHARMIFDKNDLQQQS